MLNILDIDLCGELSGIISAIWTLLKIFQILIPVALIIWGMLDFVKFITGGKEDEFAKSGRTFVKRIVAAIIFFMIVPIVSFVFQIFVPDEGAGLLSCIGVEIKGGSTTQKVPSGEYYPEDGNGESPVEKDEQE